MKQPAVSRRCHVGLSWLERRSQCLEVGASKDELIRDEWLEVEVTIRQLVKPVLMYHSKNPRVLKNYAKSGQMQWLMPVIPALAGWGGWMDHLRSGVRDQPGQHGETLSLLNIQKLAGWGGRRPLIPATQEAEAGESLEPRGGGCSEPRSCHCTPAWHLATEWGSVSKKKKEKKTQ